VSVIDEASKRTTANYVAEKTTSPSSAFKPTRLPGISAIERLGYTIFAKIV
jgi:hypothetical protein